MTKLEMKLLKKVAKRRVAQGENIDDILADWTKLTDEEREEIRKVVLSMVYC